MLEIDRVFREYKYPAIRDKNDFANICRELRSERRITQEGLALDMQVSTSTIERIENRKINPTLGMVCRILEVVGYEFVMRKKDSDVS